MTKLFVTGGTGFIGSNFIHGALKNGYDIVALKRDEFQQNFLHNERVVWLTGELDSQFQKEMSRCDILVHMASAGVTPQIADWNECFMSNVIKPLQMLKNCIQSGINKMVIIGTALEYGLSASQYNKIPVSAPLEPVGAYASSKSAFFMAAHGIAVECNIKLVYLRVFSVFGEGQFEENLWPSIKKAALSGDDFPMTKGEQVRDFIHIDELIKIIINELDFSKVKPGIPVVKNIGSGNSQTVLQFSEYWWDQFHATGKLLPGFIPYRNNEVMRIIPELFSN
jgi:nucleoside-diphosphate-sugar epimerase